MKRMVRGEGNSGCIFYVLLALVVGFLAIKIVPHQVAKLQLKDYMKELAMTAPRQPARWFEQRIKDRCEDLRIPIDAKQIKVKKTQKRIVMDVSYTVMLDLVVTDYAMREEIHLDRDIFLF